MSRSAKVTRFFGDADYTFVLEIEQLEELQEKTDCGIGDMAERLEGLRVTDIKQVLRLGLIGGAIDTRMINGRPAKEEAFRLVTRHVVAGEIGACGLVAMAVVSRAIAGVKDEPLGEAPAGDGQSQTLSREEKSGSPPSTEPAPPSATPPKKSDGARSGNSAPPSKAGPKPTARTTSPKRPRPTSTTKT